jgi:UDP-N-acetylmuramoyl-L-alanyl-D-glutamate--2,6-diaminopimelate ligase
MEVGPLSLRETLGPVSFVSAGDVTGSQFCCDSRFILPGDVFVAMTGRNQDGHRFVQSAVANGAAAVLLENPDPRISVPQCVVPDSRTAFARICMAQFGQPQKFLSIVGITGTNGKTTSTWLLRAILQTAGRTTGLLGTIEYSDGRSRQPASLTTPDSVQLAQLFSQMVRNRASHCVMELSSHALDQRRCAAVPLAAAAITNITQDHFDYHGDAENYRAAKLRIAELLTPDSPLLIGIDDVGCRSSLNQLPTRVRRLTFGFDSEADFRVDIVAKTQQSQMVRLTLMTGTIDVQTSLVGSHNALNLLTAAALAEQSGIEPAAIREGLQSVSHVPGRMERVDIGQSFTVLVDYAHTPDGIAHCVATARQLTAGRVILVFGAGGDRDRSKRPLMAQSAQRADLIFVTSDNPRSESPDQIICEICSGFESLSHVQTCVDRQKAIRMAIASAECGDVVIIAGRGHESIQEIGDRRISFNDRKVVLRMLSEMVPDKSATNISAPEAIPA